MPCQATRRSASARSTEKKKSKSDDDARAVLQIVDDGPPRFQYVGDGALTLIGPRSGRRYRFDRPGAVLETDREDGPALAGVSVLRAVARQRE